jgi:photosystem II stability/assembly factor-like uncharacterized protein
MTQHTENPLTPAEEEVKARIARVAQRGAEIRLSLEDEAKADRPSRIRSRSHYVALGAVVAVAAMVAFVLALVASPTGPPSSNSTGSTKSPNLNMELVDSTSSPFQSVGGGPQTGDLLCVTSSTCYASDDVAPTGLGWEVTHDGGMSWHALASLPKAHLLSDPVSCPAARTCIGSDETLGSQSQVPGLAWTSDGGRSWKLDQLPVPPGTNQATVERLSCPTASDCVAFLSSPTRHFFVTTTDGGSSWTTSDAPADLTGLWRLHCDPNGDCIGLVPGQSVQVPNAATIVAFRSTDWGASWASTSTPMPFSAGVLVFECGDALHCILAFPSHLGVSFDIARTSDGGQTWTTMAAPSGWPAIAISLSCADGDDCYLSAADFSRKGYDSPALEVTHDGGASWTPLQLPTVKGQPLALVYPLSCPVSAGCIGVGATVKEFDTPVRHKSPPKLTAPPPNKNRMIISNLSAAPGS